MAHFAKLDGNNKVIAVHVVNNDVITINGVESEQAGIDFLSNLHSHASWKQTSYSGSFRKNYAGIEFLYDFTKDAFIPPKPFVSWILDEATCQWEAPTPMPTDGKSYKWVEEDLSWQEIVFPK